MLHDVTVRITRNNDGTFIATGSTTTPAGGALNQRKFADATALHQFLGRVLGIKKREVDAAMEALGQRGNHSIPHVMMTAAEIEEHGLGPT